MSNTTEMDNDTQFELAAWELQEARRERDEAREKAERYRLEANSLMLQRDEARESLKHIGEYGTEEINAAVDLRQKLASALVERDEVRNELLEQARLLGMSSEREAKLISELDEARKKYDNLATEHMLVVNKLCNERDEAIATLIKIEEAFMDSENTYDDFWKIFSLTRSALEKTK